MSTSRLQIRRIEALSGQFLLVTTAPPAGWRHRGGQHVELTLGEAPVLRRYYSIASAAADPTVDFCVRLLGDGQAGAAWQALRVGDSLTTGAPQGNFGLRDRTRPAAMIAGGSGIAPMRAMLRELLAAEGAPVTLIYGVRDAAAFPYADEFSELASGSRGRLRLHLAAEAGPLAPGMVRGNLLSALAAGQAGLADADCYVCGSKALAGAVNDQLKAAGVPPDRVHMEAYG